jgi:transposase
MPAKVLEKARASVTAGLAHDVRLIPAQYVKAFLKGHKNDYRDAEAIAEAVQRPTMNFVAIKTPEQGDLLFCRFMPQA